MPFPLFLLHPTGAYNGNNPDSVKRNSISTINVCIYAKTHNNFTDCHSVSFNDSRRGMGRDRARCAGICNYCIVVYVLIFHIQGGNIIMLINATIAKQNMRLFRSTLFWGRPGAGKTLLAVAVAYSLLKNHFAKRVYSNTPLSFASVPPEEAFDEEGNWDYQHPLAKNAVYLLDEAWIGLMDFNPQSIRRLFAYPRHNNQYFLLTSVLPLSNINRYVFHTVFRYRDLTPVGLPLKIYHSQITGYKDKPVWFILGFERMYYNLYNTHYNPTGLEPVNPEGFFVDGKPVELDNNNKPVKDGERCDG